MMKKLVTFFAERSLIVNLMSVGIVLAGLVFMFSINKEAFPKVEYDFILITTLYPGATPADIEKHISIPVETELREVDGIKEIWSSSLESRSVIAIQLDPDLSEKDKTITDIKDAVDMVTDMPDEAEEPIVTELATNLVPVIEISIMDTKGIAGDADEFELRKVAKRLEDRIRELKGVAKIDKKGYRDREMTVEVDPNLLDKYHVGLNEIINALARKNLNFPGGSIKKAKEEIMIRTIGEVETIEDIGDILIRANDFGIPVRIKDVAKVRDTFEEEEITNRTEKKRAVTLTILKKESADIIDVVDKIEEELKIFRVGYDGYFYSTVHSDMRNIKDKLLTFKETGKTLVQIMNNSTGGNFLVNCINNITGNKNKETVTPEDKIVRSQMESKLNNLDKAGMEIAVKVELFLKRVKEFITANSSSFAKEVKSDIEFLREKDKETDVLIKKIEDTVSDLDSEQLKKYDKDLKRNVGLLQSVSDDLDELTGRLEQDLIEFQDDPAGKVYFDLFDTAVQLRNKSRYLLTYLDLVQYNLEDKSDVDSSNSNKAGKKLPVRLTALQKELAQTFESLTGDANDIIKRMDHLQVISKEYKRKERSFFNNMIPVLSEGTAKNIGVVTTTIQEMENRIQQYTETGNGGKGSSTLLFSESFAKKFDEYKKLSSDLELYFENLVSEVTRSKTSNDSIYSFETSNDMSYYVRRRLDVLINNGAWGLLLVFLSLFITLGWRISIVTALGIPIAFCTTFIWMGQYGLTVNLLSMFGLIVVLGMLVDDAIVVAENIYRRMEEGEPLKKAVIDGTSEVIAPVAGTILTTISAFAPLMFMSGIMGKFMWVMPAVVSVALAASWFESMFILPSHVYDIEKKRKGPLHKSGYEGGLYLKIQDFYAKILNKVLIHKVKSGLLIGILFIGSIMFAGRFLKFELFPKGNVERFVIKAEGASGISLEEMSRRMSLIEKLVAELPDTEMENFITRVGILSEQPMDPNEKQGSHYATIIVNLTPEEDRARNADEIMDQLRRLSMDVKEKEFEKLEFTHIQGGPPVGKPVSILIMGEDFDEMKKVASEYEKYLSGIKGLKDIKNNLEEGKKELQIKINEHIASMAGISVYDVATTVRTCFYGNVATEIKKSEEEIDIRVVFPESYRNDTESLKRIKIYNQQTRTLVPLTQVAPISKMVWAEGIASINRQNWKRAIQVTADIDSDATVSSLDVNRMLINDFKNIDVKYPGVVVDYKGEFEDTAESMTNLLKSFIIAFIVIYIILVALFKSLMHPFIIVSVIPLTAVGVIWAFFFWGKPLSFLAMFGVVGLAGVVVNDSIVLVDFIKRKRASGLNPLEASIQACRGRLRPVFLTTITTFFGLLPTAYGLGGNDPFLKPMAMSMSWGLIFGSFITLFATPTMYTILTSVRKAITGKVRSAIDFAPSHIEKSVDDIEHEIEEDLKACMHEEIGEILKDEVQKEVKRQIALQQTSLKKTTAKNKKKVTKKSSKKSD